MTSAAVRAHRGSRGARRERLLDLLFVLPVLVVLGVLLAVPLVQGVVLSVHETSGFQIGAFVGLEQFGRVILGDGVFQRGLVNTFAFAAAAVVLQTALGLGLAVLVADGRRGATLFQVVFFLPFVLASVAVADVWRFLYAPYVGAIASLGTALGIDTATVAPLADGDTALWAILAAFLWRFSGFTMVVYLAAIRSHPREYREHAVIEGAGALAVFRRVTWPLLWPQTAVLVLVSTLGTLRIFDMVWLMTGGGPAHATETVATHVYATAFRFLDVGAAQAMAIVLGLLILVLAIVEYGLLERRAAAVSG